jgi:hypothetical protein
VRHVLSGSAADALSHDGLCKFTRSRRRALTSWNIGAERIRGDSQTQILGHRFSRLYTDEDRAAEALTLATAARLATSETREGGFARTAAAFWALAVVGWCEPTWPCPSATRESLDRRASGFSKRRSRSRLEGRPSWARYRSGAAVLGPACAQSSRSPSRAPTSA